MIDKIFEVLDKEIPKLDSPVQRMEKKISNPFQILIKTILSARTKDTTLLKISDGLFSKIKDFKDLEKISQEELENLVYPVSFYRNKAKNLKKLAYIIYTEFNGKIPETIDDLVKLPGVGRKTANLVVVTAFNKPGICVDTHVHRIMNRIGYVKTKNPFETEMKLREKLPKKHWNKANFYLVAFGQEVCTPISPHCSKCTIFEHCQKINVTTSR